VLDQVDAYATVDELKVVERSTPGALPQHLRTDASPMSIDTHHKQGVHREESRSRGPVLSEMHSRQVITELASDILRKADQLEDEVTLRNVVPSSVAVYRFGQVQT
jgi:hypothetical protein